MKLSELIQQSHDLAVEKGWWEEPDVDEKLLMIHSEISEAVECYRNYAMHMEMLKDKPIGFPTEIADVAIRCADLLGYLDDGYKDGDLPIMTFPVLSVSKELLLMHRQIESLGTLANNLEICIDRCYAIAEFVGFDLDEVIRVKHLYNQTRSRRHGGKRI